MLPFSHDQFFDVFAAYNRALWPVAAALWLVSLGVFILVLRDAHNHRAVTALLAAHWAWAAVAYHWVYFTGVNQAATVFGAGFLAQALLLAGSSWHGSIRYGWKRTWRHVIGTVLVSYSLLYPALAELLVGDYPYIPTFGVPCPTTLLTIGFLLMATPLSMKLMIVPLIWTVIGGSAAILFGVLPDLALPAAGLTVLLVKLIPQRSLLR